MQKKDFEQAIINVKDVIFKFVHKNFEEIKKEEINKQLPNEFYTDVLSYMIERSNHFEKIVMESQSKEGSNFEEEDKYR